MKIFIFFIVIAVCVLGTDSGSPVNAFVDAFMDELSKSIKTRGAAPVSLGGALNQDCLLYGMDVFKANSDPICTNKAQNEVELTFELSYPELKLACVTKPNTGPSVQVKITPDNINLTATNIIFKVKSLVKYNAVEKSETEYTFISKELETYSIDKEFKGTQAEQNVPKIYFGMIEKDVQAFMPSSYSFALQTLAFSDKKNLFLQNCP